MSLSVWLVALGSAVGGVTRFLLGAAVQHRVGTTFPIGTLVINVSGSLLLGFLLRFLLAAPTVSPEVRAMLTAGFCGGYTTFSTFSADAAFLLESGQVGRATLYAVASVVLSITGCFAGMWVARAVRLMFAPMA
ncbi:MAG TPA: fluoride efflux transporter CrcB [Gemmatimonadaceae bacterium]|nr:fluoride efflux transporter CrcB [Gemmatimonadaceae bacterium]